MNTPTPRFMKRLARDRAGTTAIEFAMLAPIVFFVLFALAEVGSVFLVQSTFDVAVSDAARTIRTGEVQRDGLTAQALRQRICNRVLSLIPIDCQNRLSIDVDSWPDFSNAQFDPALRDGEIDQGALSFTPGGERDVVLVRVYYEWRVATPLLSFFLSNMPEQRRLIASNFLFRNEPFGELQAP